MAHNPFGNAAEQRALDASATVAPDDEKVGRPLFGRLDDFIGRISGDDEFERRWWQRQTLPETGQKPPSLLLRTGDQFSRGDSRVGAVRRGRFDHVDEGKVGSERTCKGETHVGGMGGDGLAVDSDQNVPKIHLDLHLR